MIQHKVLILLKSSWNSLQQKTTQRLQRQNSVAVLESDGLSLKLAVNKCCNLIKSYIIRNLLELCKFKNSYDDMV